MAKTLGGITLPRGIQWSNKASNINTMRLADRTVDQSVYIWEAAITSGISIVLESPEGAGWWTDQQVDSLIALCNSESSKFSFVFDSFSCTVTFDHSNGSPIDLRKLVPWSTYYIGTVKLITV